LLAAVNHFANGEGAARTNKGQRQHQGACNFEAAIAVAVVAFAMPDQHFFAARANVVVPASDTFGTFGVPNSRLKFRSS
jgi:hypothetical protein